jgi:hypothetical protein
MEKVASQNLAGLHKVWIDMTLADSLVQVGDDERADALATEVIDGGRADSNEPFLLANLAMANLGLGRRDAARSAADRLRDGIYQGPTTQALHAVADAGALVLEGAVVEAKVRFAGGFDELRRLSQNFDLARWELMAITLLPDAPEATAWATEARELFSSVGARPYLERLDAVQIGSRPRSSTARAATEAVPEVS